MRRQQVGILHLIVMSQHVIRPYTSLQNGVVRGLTLHRRYLQRLTIYRLFSAVRPTWGQGVATIYGTMKMSLVRGRPLFPRDPPTTGTSRGSRGGHSHPFFLFCFLRDFYFSSLFLSILRPGVTLLFRCVVFEARIGAFQITSPTTPDDVRPIERS